MGKILYIDSAENTSELFRLGLEERTGMEVIVASSAREAIRILKKEYSILLIISDHQSECLAFIREKGLGIPFFYFTDEEKLMIPFSPINLISVWRRNQFEELCNSIIAILHKQHR